MSNTGRKNTNFRSFQHKTISILTKKTHEGKIVWIYFLDFIGN